MSTAFKGYTTPLARQRWIAMSTGVERSTFTAGIVTVMNTSLPMRVAPILSTAG